MQPDAHPAERLGSQCGGMRTKTTLDDLNSVHGMACGEELMPSANCAHNPASRDRSFGGATGTPVGSTGKEGKEMWSP